MSRAGRVAFVTACVIATASANQARADEPQTPCPQAEAAASKKKAGDEVMQAGRPAEALAAYEGAYAACRDPAVLYNLARAHALLNDHPNALDRLEAFSRDASPALKARVPGLATQIEETRARVATLAVYVQVDAAKVRVAEKLVGVANAAVPLVVRVNAGRATVEVAAEGYVAYTVVIDLAAQRQTDVRAELRSQKRAGTLRVQSPVEGSYVFVDGQPLGAAPVETEMAIGSHRVVVRHEGYTEASRDVSVEAGARSELTLSPEAKRGVTGQWWFWAGLGGLAAAGAATTVILLSTEKSPDRGSGFTPGSATVAPVVRF